MKHDIIFEVIPPSKIASESSTNKLIDRIGNVVRNMKNMTILNVPEIVEENHIGLPYYRNADNREFGLILKEKSKKDIMLNTVVVHKPREKFEQWLGESIDKYGINNFVFVGAKMNGVNYPGHSVIEANSIAKGKKINIGNIFIPERKNEAERLISKTASGCRFFTSQVLFEPEKVVNVIHEYSIKCKKADFEPAKFFLSFSPVSNLEDITFIKWLGAEMGQKTENRLKCAQNIGEESIKVGLEVLHKIFDSLNKLNVNIPLGLNIEYISLHNLEFAKILCEKLKYELTLNDYEVRI